MTEPRLTFLDQNEWEHWLTQNGATSAGIWLRLAKKGAGQLTLTCEQALESALCHGWIDGQKRAENEEYWLQRFTRRTAKSIWSRLNKDRAEALIAAGRMLASGMRKIEEFWQGFWTNLLNPKVLLFMIAFLPQFANPDRGPVELQLLFLAGYSKSAGLVTGSFICYGASRIRRWFERNPWFAKVQEGVLGAVMIGIGLSIISSRDTASQLLASVSRR